MLARAVQAPIVGRALQHQQPSLAVHIHRLAARAAAGPSL